MLCARGTTLMRPSGRFLSDLGSENPCLNIVQQLIDRLPRDNAPSLSTFLGHLSGSKARTTQRVYLREISMWLDWCETCGLLCTPGPWSFSGAISQLPVKPGRVENRGGIGPRCHRLVARTVWNLAKPCSFCFCPVLGSELGHY